MEPILNGKSFYLCLFSILKHKNFLLTLSTVNFSYFGCPRCKESGMKVRHDSHMYQVRKFLEWEIFPKFRVRVSLVDMLWKICLPIRRYDFVDIFMWEWGIKCVKIIEIQKRKTFCLLLYQMCRVLPIFPRKTWYWTFSLNSYLRYCNESSVN